VCSAIDEREREGGERVEGESERESVAIFFCNAIRCQPIWLVLTLAYVDIPDWHKYATFLFSIFFKREIDGRITAMGILLEEREIMMKKLRVVWLGRGLGMHGTPNKSTYIDRTEKKEMRICLESQNKNAKHWGFLGISVIQVGFLKTMTSTMGRLLIH